MPDEVPNEEYLKTGVSIATLGSIAILTASFLQKTDFILNYIGIMPSPVSPYILAGLALLLSSGSFLLYNHLRSKQEWLHNLFELSLLIGLVAFFIASFMTFFIYFRFF